MTRRRTLSPASDGWSEKNIAIIAKVQEMRCLNFIFFRLIPTWVIRCELRIQLHLRERNRKKIVLLRVKCPAALEHKILLAIHSLPLEISDDALLKSGRIEIILSDSEKILAENLALFPPDDVEIPVSEPAGISESFK